MPQNRYGEHGESKTITRGTKWGKTKPLHWNIGEHGK